MKWLFNDGAFFILSKRKEGEKVGGALAKKKDCDTSKKKSHQLCLSSLFNLNGNGIEFNKKVKHSYNIKCQQQPYLNWFFRRLKVQWYFPLLLKRSEHFPMYHGFECMGVCCALILSLSQSQIMTKQSHDKSG